MRRWVRIVAILLVLIGCLELLWVITANRYLQSRGFHELLQKDGFTISFDKASSPFPGKINVQGLILQSAETRLELPEARLQFSLMALIGKKIIFWSAHGQDGSLHFKPVPPDAPSAEASGPVSQGSSASASAAEDNDWTVHFQKLAFDNLQSLTVGSFAAKGSIDFEAELHLAAQDQVRIEKGRLRIREGQTQWNDQTLARVQSLQGRFELDPFRMKDNWLRKLSLDLTGQAELEEGQVLQNILLDAPWLKIKGLNLKTAGRVVLKQGQLMAPTRVEFESSSLELELWKETVSGHGKLVVAADENLQLNVNIPAFTVDRDSKGTVDVSGRDLSLKLATANRDLASRERNWQAALQLPESTIHDLRYFNHFMPKGLGFQFKSGQGRVQMQLDSASKSGNYIRMEAPQAQVTYEKQEFHGRIKQELDIAAIDFVQEGFTVPTGEVHLQVRPGGKDSKEKDWSGRINLQDGRVQITPSRFEGQLQLQAADLRPLLWIFDPRSKLPDWSRQLFRKDNLKATFHLKADESSYAIDNFKAETDELKLEAWYQSAQEKKRGKLFMRYGGLSAGIGVNDDDFKFQLLSSREWFQNRQ